MTIKALSPLAGEGAFLFQLKDLFIRRYLEGYTPHQIFVDAGFDLKMLGSKRIERAAARWRELCFSDSENKEDVLKSISERKTITNTERIIRLEDQVRDLQRKVDMLLKEKGYS